MVLAFILGVSAVLASGTLGGPVDVAFCGPRPGMLEKLFTNAAEIRRKCIEDAYEANRQKLIAEANELDKLQRTMQDELKQVAYTYSHGMIRCSPPAGTPANPARTRRCQELNDARNAVIDRMNTIMGWNDRPLPPKSEPVSNAQVTPPCPTKEQLDKLRAVRHLNRKAFETWERCVQLNPENYYN